MSSVAANVLPVNTGSLPTKNDQAHLPIMAASKPEPRRVVFDFFYVYSVSAQATCYFAPAFFSEVLTRTAAVVEPRCRFLLSGFSCGPTGLAVSGRVADRSGRKTRCDRVTRMCAGSLAICLLCRTYATIGGVGAALTCSRADSSMGSRFAAIRPPPQAPT